MRTFACAFTLAILVGQTIAQEIRPTVPVVITAGNNDPCGSGVVIDLDPRGDGFLAVKAGPGLRFARIDKIYNGSRSICARNKAIGLASFTRGQVKERLLWAASELHHASPKDIRVSALREALASIHRDLNTRKAKDQEGTTAATIKAMRRKTASKIAERIFDLYDSCMI